jgi:hypothetical protein
MAPTDNTVASTLHDLGLAAWFGGSLMGDRGKRRRRRGPGPHPAPTGGQHRLGPLDPTEPGRYRRPLAGGAVLTGANKGRLAAQQGVAANSTVKTALTVAAY